MNTLLSPLVGFISILGMLGLGVATSDFEVSRANAAGGPTVYASFDSQEAKGVVEVQRYMSGAGSIVTARIKRPESGLVGFCLYRADGSRACQTVNPTSSGFDKSSKGCASFTISFSETVTHAAITDTNFVNVIALAPLTLDAPNNVASLTPCR